MMTNVILDDDQVLRILRILGNKEFCTVNQVGAGLKVSGVNFTHAQVYTRLEKLTKSIPPYADRVQVGIRNHYRITDTGRELIAPSEEPEKVNVRFRNIRYFIERTLPRYPIFTILMIAAVTILLMALVVIDP